MHDKRIKSHNFFLNIVDTNSQKHLFSKQDLFENKYFLNEYLRNTKSRFAYRYNKITLN